MTVPQAFCLTLVGTLLLSSVQTGTFDVGPDTDPLSDQRIMVRLFPGAELAEFINTFEDDHARLRLTLSPLDAISATHQSSTGAGTVIAVLDTGVDASHPVLEGRVLPNGFNFVDGNSDTDDVGDGQDTDNDGEVDELVGHGTFVSSLIVLVAPDTKILPVRVLDGDGLGDHWIVAQGLYYAIDRGVETTTD